ncbi:MAG: autotransporter-associated beta strand repeat-containing protein, partial [Akkermansia sp.]|nr:autotransporter-associated beta strand repeat-containing protein [Akkermansia sp.]
MKPHLPVKLLSALLACLASVATLPSSAETYTWLGTTDTMVHTVSNFLPVPATWQEAWSASATNVMRFDVVAFDNAGGTHKAAEIQFDTLSLAGIEVASNSDGFSLVANRSRAINLRAGTSGATVFDIASDFSLGSSSVYWGSGINLHANLNINLSNDAVFSLYGSFGQGSSAQTVTVSGDGNFKMFGNASSTFAANWLITDNAIVDAIHNNSGSSLGKAVVTVNKGATLNYDYSRDTGCVLQVTEGTGTVYIGTGTTWSGALVASNATMKLTKGDLEIVSGGTFSFESGSSITGAVTLGSGTMFDIDALTGTTKLLSISDALAINGDLFLTEETLAAITWSEGTYSLIEAGSITGIAENTFLIGSDFMGAWNVDGKTLNLVVSELNGLFWNGGTAANWGAENVWDSDGSAASYTDGTAVNFMDLPGIDKTVVTITSDVSPGNVLVSNTNTEVEFTGANGILDSQILKTGEGTLVLGTASILGDGTTISVNEGTVAFGYSTGIDWAKLTIADGATIAATNGAEVSVGLGLMSPAFNVSANEDSTVKLENTTAAIFSGNILAGAGNVVKTGTGTLALTGEMSGNFVVEQGAVNVGSGSSQINWGTEDSSVLMKNGTTLAMNGGGYHHVIGSDITFGEVASDTVTLTTRDASAANASSYQYSLTGDVTVNGQLTISTDSNNWAKETAFLGSLSGDGSITAKRGAGDGGMNTNGKLVVSGDASAFTGSITIDATNNFSYGLDVVSSISQASVTLNSGTDATNCAYIRVLGDVEIGTLNGTENSLVGAAAGTRVLTIGGGDYAGRLQDKSYGVRSNSIAQNGVLSLIKVSTDDLTLSGTVNITGSLSVNAGKVLVTGTGATSVGDISIAQGAQMSTGGDLNLGSNLSLGVNADMASLIVGGAFEGGVIALDLTGLENLVDAKEYTLISAASGLGEDKSTFNWNDTGANDLLSFSLVQTDTELKLVAVADAVIWNGTTDNTDWDNADTSNWVSTSGGSISTTDGIALVFNDDAESKSVDIVGTISPTLVSVNNSTGNDYTFKGTGSISGDASLIKRGEGFLTIENANAYTGGTEIAAGKIIIGDASALGTGDITFSGGSLEASSDVTLSQNLKTKSSSDYLKLSASNGMTLALTASQLEWNADATIANLEVLSGTVSISDIENIKMLGADVKVASGATLALAGGSEINIYSNLDGIAGTVSRSGDNTMLQVKAVNGSETFAGKLVNTGSGGSIRFSGYGATAAPTFTFTSEDALVADTVSATMGVVFDFQADQTFTTLMLGEHASNIGNSIAIIGSDTETIVQTLTLKGANKGTVNVDGTLALTTATLENGSAINVESSGKLDLGTAGAISGAGTVNLNGGELIGDGEVSSTLNIKDGVTSSLSVGNIALNGALTGSGSLEVNGAAVTLGNVSAEYDGEVIVSGGSLSTSVAFAGDMKVAGGTLDMNSVAVTGDVTVSSGKLVDAESYVGVLTIDAVAGTADTENSIDLGGVTSVDSLTLAADSSITGLGGAL